MYKKIAEEKFNNLKNNFKTRDIIILGIESSCDETSVSIVKNGREVLSNVISSQIDIHKRFGGVVPEVASRNHVLAIDNVVKEALEISKVNLEDINAIAVTYGAGLMGALMVGVTYAKSLAYALKLPLIKVNHIKGHISANYIAYENLTPPFIALVVSGGHTAIIKVNDYCNHTLIATTTDDAIGECYDKVAKVLGLGYPGGPVIDKYALEGKENITFINNANKSKKDSGISYSGLKTAVINYLHKQNQNNVSVNINDVCASFQKEAVNPLVDKLIYVAKKQKCNKIVVAGGVAANSYLRNLLTQEGKKNKIEVFVPPMKYCTDNAAMIACEAYYNLINGQGLSDLELTANPSINLKYTKK